MIASAHAVLDLNTLTGDPEDKETTGAEHGKSSDRVQRVIRDAAHPNVPHDPRGDNTMSGGLSSITTPSPNAISGYHGPQGFQWLVKGRLGGAPQPGLLRQIAFDLDALRRVGTTILVTLTQEWDPPTEEIAARGMTSLHMKIPDMEAPSLDDAQEMCRRIDLMLSDGEVIVHHCRAGRGRTGTMLAAQLVWSGIDADQAIQITRSANPRWIESDTQERFLQSFWDHRQQILASEDPRV